MFEAVACNGDDESSEGARPPAASSGAPRGVEQVPPPLDLKTPPGDATKTSSGLIYKKLAINEAGTQPRRGDTALVRYTGWRQRSGATFFTTKNGEQPIAIDIAHAAPGFAEALALLHKGEKAVLWIPPSQGTPEVVVYEVEVVDVVSPPPIAKRASKDNAAAPHAEPH